MREGMLAPAVRPGLDGCDDGLVISWSCGLRGTGAVGPCCGFVVFTAVLEASVQDAGQAAGARISACEAHSLTVTALALGNAAGTSSLPVPKTRTRHY